MTMYYSGWEDELMKARLAELERLPSAKPEMAPPYSEVPDYEEAERIWELLVLAATN